MINPHLNARASGMAHLLASTLDGRIRTGTHAHARQTLAPRGEQVFAQIVAALANAATCVQDLSPCHSDES